jgi:hypothetical protein
VRPNIKRGLAAAICVATVLTAQAKATEPEVLTAETLRSFCSSTDSNLRRICSFYILGVVQGLAIGASPDTNLKAKCVRDSLAASEMVKAFMDRSAALKVAFPSDMAAPAVSIVAATVASKFPCEVEPPTKTHR